MNDSSVDVSYLVNRQKIIFIGDVSVGKTSIINVLMGQKFNNEYEASIGVDFFSKTIKYKGKTIKLQIWDSARLIDNGVLKNGDTRKFLEIRGDIEFGRQIGVLAIPHPLSVDPQVIAMPHAVEAHIDVATLP